KHNNANCIALGGRCTGVEVAKECVLAYLATEFEGGRHERRVNKMTLIENKI
ncbi:sugar-phosphate isomerase, RpiB/LacA/LacB family, partial [Kipferlia bialata]